MEFVGRRPCLLPNPHPPRDFIPWIPETLGTAGFYACLRVARKVWATRDIGGGELSFKDNIKRIAQKKRLSLRCIILYRSDHEEPMPSGLLVSCSIKSYCPMPRDPRVADPWSESSRGETSRTYPHNPRNSCKKKNNVV